jgi:predicted nucleic-acid-binding protein
MLELVWGLESNDCTPSEICHGLGLLMNLHNFKPAYEHVIRKALTAYANGLEFADALHLGLSQKEEVLLTFDKSFVKQASQMNQLPAVQMAK